MKKRIVSLVLATAMVLTSFNVYANDNIVDQEGNIVVAADDVASGSGADVDGPGSDTTETNGPSWATTAPWKATVYGDCGGQVRIDNFNSTDDAVLSANYYKDENGNYIRPYDVQEDGTTVRIRMGVPDADPTVNPQPSSSRSTGKIASGSEGMVYYYQELKADDDFTLSATASVNAIYNANNQVSFGASVRDNVLPLDGTSEEAKATANVSAGPVKMANAEKGGMAFGWVRPTAASEMDTSNTTSTLTVAPTVGKEYPVSIKKSGTAYTITFGDESATIDGSEFAMSDSIYAGLFAARCADVTFTNVRLSVAGAAVEVGDWESNGNGICGTDGVNAATNKLSQMVETHNDDNSEIEISIKDAGSGQGKFSDSEDSYYYRAMKAPAGEDFTISTKMSTTLSTSCSNPKQMGAGMMIFNSHYVKNVTDGVTPAGETGKSVFIGARTPSGDENQYFVVRVNNGTTKTDTVLFATGKALASATEYYDVKVKKSGDVLKVKVKAEDGTVLAEQDFQIAGVFTDNEYIGYCVARDGKVSVKENSVTVGAKKIKDISIASMPTQTEYYSTQPFDATGLKLNVTYTDGTSGVLDYADEDDASEMSFLGFDEGKAFTALGERTVTCAVGAASVEIPVTVRGIKVTNINVVYQPVTNEYVTGALFKDAGLSATATFEDGTTKNISADNRVYTINGNVFENGQAFDDSMVGDTVIKLSYGNDETVDPNGVFGDVPVSVKKATIKEISIFSTPQKKNYVVGDEYDPSGLVVSALFANEGSDETTLVVLDPSEYTVTGFDSSKAVASQTLTIVYNAEPSITTSYDISIVEVGVLGVEIDSYPRLTYEVGEEFDPSGLSVLVTYNNGKEVPIDRSSYYTFDGTSYSAVDAATGEVSASDEATATAGDGYYVDLSNFNNAAAGSTSVKVVVPGYGYDFDLVATITDKREYYWKGTFFGASSLGVNETSEPSDMTLTKTDGSTYIDNTSVKQIEPELMQNGQLDGVDKVRLNSWNGAGKVSGDQDGIAYYYTKVDGTQNFKVSGTVTVNRYVMDPDDPSDAGKIAAKQKSVLNDTGVAIDTVTALDMQRSGQECFGIMARDIVPLAGDVVNGVYMGGLNNHMTTDSDLAIKDENGCPVDLYEAWKDGLVVTDSEGNRYSVSRENVSNTIASNIVIAGGCTDSTYPTDPTSSTYYKKINMNRINLMIRTGVVAIDGGGTRVGIKSTTSSVPVKGDKYRITLQKLNSGFSITTYDYQTGKTNTQYDRNTEFDAENVLNIQNAKDIYVGFFASRWADIDVEDIELYEIDPATDLVDVPLTEDIYSPTISVGSSLYSTRPNYTLYAKVNNPSGGVANISLNGKLVYSNVHMGKKLAGYPLVLDENTVNNVVISYTPSTADNCSSYATVIGRYQITETNLSSLDTLYVSPDGGVTGDGTRENPLDLESAIGFAEFGSTIIMLDGTYHIRNTDAAEISIGEVQAGSATGRKTICVDEGAHAVIDLDGMYAGFQVAGNYWTFKDFELTNSGGNMKPFLIGASHTVVKGVTSHDHQDVGIQISRILSSQKIIDTWPSNNLIQDCECYNNCDPSMQNADGFAAKLTTGYNNVFEDCISHHNLDDGWDCYTKLSTGAIGPVSLENCIAYRNGIKLNADGTDQAYDSATASGNGFKLGGENIMVKHYLKDAKTWGNRANGVDSNNNPGFKMRNVIAYGNLANNIALYTGSGQVLQDSEGNSRDAQKRVYKYDNDIKGVVSFGGNSADKVGSLTFETDYGNANDTPLLNETNYWQYEAGSLNPVATAEDGSTTQLDPATFFVSTDRYDGVGSDYRYPRNEDGTFNHGSFLQRTEEYVHEAGDEIVLPDNGSDDDITESTSSDSSEATTSSRRSSSGGGGGGSSKINTTTTTDASTESTTAAVVDDDDNTGKPTKVYKGESLASKINPPAEGESNSVFTDVPDDHWAATYVNALAGAGIVSGMTEDTFEPNASAKRADVVILIAKTLGLDNEDADNFDDVDPEAYYAPYLATAKANGIASGYPDNTFAPENNITRQDVFVLFAKTFEALGVKTDTDESVLDNFSDASEISEYARPYVAALANMGSVNGNALGELNPKANVTRAEISVLIAALWDSARTVADNAAKEKATAQKTEATTEATTAQSNDEAENTTSEGTTEGTTEAPTEATTRAKSVVKAH